MKIVLRILRCCFLFYFFVNCNVLYSLTFDEFKANIVDKDGATVYGYITPKLENGVAFQLEEMRKHMEKDGHFGYKNTISKSNTPVNWSTFLIKDGGILLKTSAEQSAKISGIWNSKLLIYVL